jgi:hypothetical protein
MHVEGRLDALARVQATIARAFWSALRQMLSRGRAARHWRSGGQPGHNIGPSVTVTMQLPLSQVLSTARCFDTGSHIDAKLSFCTPGLWLLCHAA